MSHIINTAFVIGSVQTDDMCCREKIGEPHCVLKPSMEMSKSPVLVYRPLTKEP